jgi:hypothetical protein
LSLESSNPDNESINVTICIICNYMHNMQDMHDM